MSDKLTKEQSNNTEKPQSKYILPEKMKSLEDVITRIHSEADFISTAFGVHTNKVMESFPPEKSKQGLLNCPPTSLII